MDRLALAVITAVGIGSTAVAQTGQFPGVAPPVPAPSPPAIAPGPAAPQSLQRSAPSRAPTVVQRRRGSPVVVPHGRHDTFSDRVMDCVHYGSAAGVQPHEIGRFTRECVNN